MKKIFIVDDDRDIVESLEIVLQSQGFTVASQYDQNGVIDNAASFAADLVILDVMFPEDQGAGFHMARELKADSRTAAVPILMLSAVNEKGSYAGTFSNRDLDDSWMPVQEFVEKPIKPEMLIEKVKALLAAAK